MGSNSATALNDELVEALLFPLDEEDVFPLIDDEQQDDENHRITVLLTDNRTTTEIGFSEYLLDAMEWPKSEHSMSVLPSTSTLPNTNDDGNECYHSSREDDDDDDDVVHHFVAPDNDCINNSCSSRRRSIVNNNNNINTTAADLVDSILFPTVDDEGIIEDKLLTAVVLTEKETDTDTDTDTETEDTDEFGEFLLDAIQWL